MPQKVNPIDFENSEGNAQLANSIWEGMDRKLAVSRLQRDLSDSTTIRNVGVGLGYGLLAYRNTLAGLRRVHPNTELMQGKLNENWVILTEGVQTVLRKTGAQDPYSMVAGLSRGQRIGQEEWQEWVDGLPVSDDVKGTLKNLTPATYIGLAEKLTDMALIEIAESRTRK
ncbi:MAG: Adenylosuccinate lyase [Candidatus Daviesbacteria bacterium GW2011_GWA1_38_7]|nr:MAG: Adenylosuccinate lyase [Candidatus Daviesbacteria bacterium GW2011_GWA1_38_7]